MENKNNDIKVNCERNLKIEFSRGFKLLVGFGIFLIGCVLSAYITFLFNIESPKSFEIIALVFKLIQMLTCFITLIYILANKRPFSKTIVWCVYLLGFYYIIASFIFPIFPTFNTDFYILQFSSFYIDGNYLLKGLIILVFARIIKYGFEYQNRDDETL